MKDQTPIEEALKIADDLIDKIENYLERQANIYDNPSNLTEKQAQILDLAIEALNISRNTIAMDMRFLDEVLARIKFKPVDADLFMASNGKFLYFEPNKMIENFAQNPDSITASYLHTAFHCIFKHMYRSSMEVVERNLWDLACDIVVDNVILDICVEPVNDHLGQPTWKHFANKYYKGNASKKHQVIDDLRKEIGVLTAEKVYVKYFEDDLLNDQKKFRELYSLFTVDSHEVWYLPNYDDPRYGDNGKGKGDQEGKHKNNSTEKGNIQPEYRSFQNPEDSENNPWNKTLQRLKENLESFSSKFSGGSGAFYQSIKEINREKYDYTEFLKSFATMHEVMRLDPDEFDYIYYTYGLDHYDNMPLIEPLEYRQDKRIKDFVIAIDTSGSVQGSLVQAFLQKTVNIIKNEQSFLNRFNLHLIQCDDDITEDVKITSQDNLDDYVRKMTLKGFGGTDFRPVFKKVDEYLAKKEFTNLKGMLYFTDGYGTFPDTKPPYKVAFVFVLPEGVDPPEVPVWAIKLILRPMDLEKMKKELK